MTKNIELPPRVAQAFVKDMRAFFKANIGGAGRDAEAAELILRSIR
jgi:hypothetical protein